MRKASQQFDVCLFSQANRCTHQADAHVVGRLSRSTRSSYLSTYAWRLPTYAKRVHRARRTYPCQPLRARFGDLVLPTTTAATVVRALANALILLTLEEGLSPDSAQHRLIQALDAVSSIICMGKLETHLDVDEHAVEELMNDIAILPPVALLVTSHVTSIPAFR